MANPIYFRIGDGGEKTPLVGSTSYVNTDMAGVTAIQMVIHRNGTLLYPGIHYTARTGGGFEFVIPTDIFEATGEYAIQLAADFFAVDTVTGSYTNGFCLSKVMAKLFGRVGWYQPAGSSDPVLDATNLLSKGGRFFNDGSFHALVTLQNIKNVMEQSAASDADFNAYITRLQRSIIIRSLNGVFSETEFIEQTLLYKRSYGNNSLINNNSKFIAVRIIVPPKEDIAVQLDSVALLFDSAVTFNLYVFNDIIEAPIHTVEVTTVANTQTIVEFTDVILNHVGDTNHGGIFYLGYFQDDIGAAKAVREEDVAFVCNTIFGYSTIESDPVGATNFNRSEISYTNQSNGLNPHISVFRDHTWQIIKKPALFDNLIGLQMAAQTVEQILFSNRSNKGERSTKESIDQAMGMMELEGVAPISDSPRSTGLRKQISQELQRVKQSFSPKKKSAVVNVC